MSLTTVAGTGLVTRSQALVPGVDGFSNVHAIRTDDLALEMSEHGRITGLAVGKLMQPLAGTGGFSIADFHDLPVMPNLVTNPGFEQGTTGWKLVPDQVLDETTSRTGGRSARLRVPGPLPGTTTMGVTVAVKPHTLYRIGAWTRRQGVWHGGVFCSELDRDGKPCGRQAQESRPIPSDEGAWKPVFWEIRTSVETRNLHLRVSIYKSVGTLWVDDCLVQEVSEGEYEHLVGEVREAGVGRVEWESAVARRGVRLQARIQSQARAVAFDGEVVDTTGRDRALAVRFALPLDLSGWKWHLDSEERELITTNSVHRFTYPCESGIGECSIYPWSAWSSQNTGLSLALPLQQGPRVFILQHDQRIPETSVTFYLGLSLAAQANPGRARFQFVLYNHDPAWGMRSAIQRYYELYPESFRKRTTYEGYLNYAGLEALDSPRGDLVLNRSIRLPGGSDFGKGYEFVWQLHGGYCSWQLPSLQPERPSDMEIIEGLRRQEQERSAPRGATSVSELQKRVVQDAKGRIRFVDDTRYWHAYEGYNRTANPGWGLNFRVNEDPDISASMATLCRQAADRFQRANRHYVPWSAAVTADAIEGYFANERGLNYRPEHFRTTLLPLSFGRDTGKPAMISTIWDFHHKFLRPFCDQNQFVLYGNANQYELAFVMPFVDVAMAEYDWDPAHPGRLDRFMRAVAGQKIWRYWHAWDEAGKRADADPERVRRHGWRGLAYAFFPPVYCVGMSSTKLLESLRADLTRWVEIIEQLSAAGWEPIPQARADEGVVVERFGSYPEGDLHFTLRNYGRSPVTTRLALERKPLGIPDNQKVAFLELFPAEQAAPSSENDAVSLTVPSSGSVVLRVR